MSYVNRILSAMRYDQEYTPDEVAAITHVDRYETFKALKLLSQGGLVETVGADRFIKKTGSTRANSGG